VISGFVSYLTGRNLGWKDFAAKRLLRTLPLYWLVTAIAFAGIAVQGEPIDTATLLYLLRPLVLLPGENPDGGPCSRRSMSAGRSQEHVSCREAGR
jgi:peptidoglycan/LPS O-acetylase OafA/YrhL